MAKMLLDSEDRTTNSIDTMLVPVGLDIPVPKALTLSYCAKEILMETVCCFYTFNDSM
jgi:hypothetical protein